MVQNYELDPSLLPKVDHATRIAADEAARKKRDATRKRMLLEADRKIREQINSSRKKAEEALRNQSSEGATIQEPNLREIFRSASDVPEGEDPESRRERAREASKIQKSLNGKPISEVVSQVDEQEMQSLLIDHTPMTDAEFDLAWTEAPIEMKPGVVVEFGASDVEEVENPFSSLAREEDEDSDLFFDIDRVEERFHGPTTLASLEDLQIASERSQDGRLPGTRREYGLTRLDQFKES